MAKKNLTKVEKPTNKTLKIIEFNEGLVFLMVSSLTTNLELCACYHKDSKDYSEFLMNGLKEAYEAKDMDKLVKWFGSCRKHLLENNII